MALVIYSCNKQVTEQNSQDAKSIMSGAKPKTASLANSYKSLVQGGKHIEIILNDSNGVIYYSRQEVAKDSSIGSRIYNTTSTPIVDGKFEVPLTGVYWWIPFEDEPPVLLSSGKTWCYECQTFIFCQGEKCEWTDVGGGAQDCLPKCADGECIFRRWECEEGGLGAVGAGLIIAADKVEAK